MPWLPLCPQPRVLALPWLMGFFKAELRLRFFQKSSLPTRGDVPPPCPSGSIWPSLPLGHQMCFLSVLGAELLTPELIVFPSPSPCPPTALDVEWVFSKCVLRERTSGKALPLHSLFLLPAPGTTLAQADCRSTCPPGAALWLPASQQFRMAAPQHLLLTPSSSRPSHLFSSPCLARGAEAPGEAFPSPHLAHLPPRPHLVGFAPLVLGTLFSFLGLPSLCSSPLRNFKDFERHLSLPPKLTSSLDFSKMWSHF